MINQIKKGRLVSFSETLFVSSRATSSERIREFDSQNMILFQIKVFGGNVKETILARCFIKITARRSFT